jgi:imidazolonepropionase-like amidohydrolase
VQPPIDAPAAGLTAILASWLFDGTGQRSASRPDGGSGRPAIISVEYGAPAPRGADVVDLTGSMLLPGSSTPTSIWRSTRAATPSARWPGRTTSSYSRPCVTPARATLAAGITTVRDLGDRNYLSLQLRGETDLPTIVTSGPPDHHAVRPLPFLGGAAGPRSRRHPRRCQGARRARGRRQSRSWPAAHHDARDAPGGLQFSAEELRAAVEEAHAHGLPVTAHAHGSQAIADAVAAGVDGLEHASFWSADGIDDPGPMVERIARSRIQVGMTVGQVQVDGMTPPPAILQRLPALLVNERRLHQAGAVIVAATDAGIGPTKPRDVLRYTLPPSSTAA